MQDLMFQTAVWLVAILGVCASVYTVIKWRRAARACHPMPFRRRKGYLTGLVFCAVCLAAPAFVLQDRTPEPFQMEYVARA